MKPTVFTRGFKRYEGVEFHDMDGTPCVICDGDRGLNIEVMGEFDAQGVADIACYLAERIGISEEAGGCQ